jgi:predicted nucleic acid-binding protein
VTQMATKVLDSWALLAFFEDEPAAEQVEQLLAQAADDIAMVRQAAIYKATHKMAYADAFAAALAKEYKAELVTGDPEFKPLEKEIKINWLK